ncbi:MAG: cytochrome b5 domain-containing protein [Candidatus Izemoplasmataceae bacterium]
MKKIFMMFLVVFSVILITGCSTDIEDEENNDTNNDMNNGVDEEEYIYLTLAELAEFDGLEGRAAYIAVDGKIYDVSDSNYWSGGNHNSFQAGQDLTNEIMSESPHGIANLDRVPLIGEIVEEE